MLQETTLFSGTIRDNIAFGRPDASMDEVIAAAQAAAAHDFILDFPQGYDTPVGERGTTLSGGQKQRIAIARALLMDPRILILDDSTSSVDTVTEYQIQQALDRLMKGRTSFVIAQRISTVRNADLILVLDKGRVVAQGKHDDLMENSAIYAEIYARSWWKTRSSRRRTNDERPGVRPPSFVIRLSSRRVDMHGFGGGPRRMMEQEVSKPKNVGATLGRLGAAIRPLLAGAAGGAGAGGRQHLCPGDHARADRPERRLLPDARRPPSRRGEHGRSVRDWARPPGARPAPRTPTAGSTSPLGTGAMPVKATPQDYMAGLGRLVLVLVDPVRAGLADGRAAVLPDELGRAARAQGAARQGLRAPAPAVARATTPSTRPAT